MHLVSRKPQVAVVAGRDFAFAQSEPSIPRRRKIRRRRSYSRSAAVRLAGRQDLERIQPSCSRSSASVAVRARCLRMESSLRGVQRRSNPGREGLSTIPGLFPGLTRGSTGHGSTQRSDHHFSLNGRASTSKLQAARSWLTRSAAIAATPRRIDEEVIRPSVGESRARHRTADHAVDDDQGDMDARRPEVAGHRSGERTLRHRGLRKRGGSCRAASRGGRADDDERRAPLLHRRDCAPQEETKRADAP